MWWSTGIYSATEAGHVTPGKANIASYGSVSIHTISCGRLANYRYI